MKFGAPLIQTIVCTSFPFGGDHPCEEERMLMTVVSTMLFEGAPGELKLGGPADLTEDTVWGAQVTSCTSS
jgi:hypothetical protein